MTYHDAAGPALGTYRQALMEERSEFGNARD
jgi:hypothetical protein